MQGTRLGFRTKEDAIHFAEKQGWDYYVYVPRSLLFARCIYATSSQQPEIKVRLPKNYSENFLYKPNKLRLIRTK